MVKTKKTILGVVLGILMALCLILGITGLSNSKTVRADDDVVTSGTHGGIQWEWDAETQTITISACESDYGTGWMPNYEAFEDTPWAQGAQIGDDDIKQIVVNEGVYKIGDYAFEDCGEVTDIWLPDSLTTIGHYGFDSVGEDTGSGATIHGSNVFSVIGTKAFVDSHINGQIIMGEGWERLNSNAFTDSHISSVYICKPNSSDSGFAWEKDAFRDADHLIDVTFGEGVTYVQEGTFYDCDSLCCVEFPESMQYVNEYAFYECNAIQNVYCRGEIGKIFYYKNNSIIADYANYDYCENWEQPTYIYNENSTTQLTKYCSNYQLLMPYSELNGKEWLVRSKYEIHNTIEVTEDSTIVLLDNCGLTVSGSIHVHPGKTLYIVSESLDADKMGSIVTSAAVYNAGIGGRDGEWDSTVIICGGNIETYGGEGGAGIGDGNGGNATVIIYDGKIKATGGEYGAGIGSGNKGNATVTIYGGDIEAHNGDGGAGIGSGYMANATVTINGGNIRVTNGRRGAGIGSGWNGNVTVTINGGNINATGGPNGAGIGSGFYCNATVTIKGGKITATGGENGAGIGSGYGREDDRATSIIIDGGDIEAIGGNNGAGIGSGYMGDATIIIDGGDIEAIGGNNGAGIGSGASSDWGAICKVELWAGKIDATAGAGAEKIGAGVGSSATVWSPKYIDGNGNICYCNKDKSQNLTSKDSVLNGNWWIVRSNTVIDHAIEVTKDSTIVLCDNCELTVNGGIHVQPGKSLYIVSASLDADKMGSLKVTSAPEKNAGIGGGGDESGANVFICGGKIEVTGGDYAAGIGSGYVGNSNVTIYNGNVTAIGGYWGAGIGSGYYGNATVTIKGGDIKAADGYWGAGIGSGYKGYATVTIDGGDIKSISEYLGAGIGSGNNGEATVTIDGGNIEATGGNNGAGIGSGSNGKATVTIDGGDITAIGGNGAAGIGSGYGSGKNGGVTVTIDGGDITATGGNNGAGIGSGNNGDATVTIDGGNIEAAGGNYGAGIGSGYCGNVTLTLYKGNIKATGSKNAKNIGAGLQGYATVHDYRNGNGLGTFMSGGSIVIICIAGGVALISAGVFMFLYFRKKKD